ncbi:putative secreted protein [Litoreibacter ponti]|uniref:Putative secreted protein n=1 Tax=Litoreibacter ponti TaxID=1510457 RepID=A0A2T6BI92_9RHOB|nr:VPLPA-CTERM sorting domain-containing protein [Litoreibacter ponti]PTX55772.1 putative secreted protein [Litoreibacter ponti]
MNFFAGALVTAALSVGATLAAQATTVTFDFASASENSGYFQRASKLSFEKDGLDLDVSAHGYVTPQNEGDELNAWTSLKVTRQNSYGLYIYSYWGDDHRVDGHWNEALKFDFNGSDVSIASIRFGSYGSNDVFDLFVGDNGQLLYEGSNEVATWVHLDTETSSLFAIGASENHSAFKVKKLVVNVAEPDDNEPEPVPLPAGGVLLLTGLAALVARRKLGRSA